MKSLVILLFIAGALHVLLQVPTVLAVGGALALWVVWKLKFVILAVLGLEMLFGGGGGGGNA